MVRIGLIVEGDSDDVVFKHAHTKVKLSDACGVLVTKVVNARGNRNQQGNKIRPYVQILVENRRVDKIVLLTDLDKDDQIKCITERKRAVGRIKHLEQILVARNCLESWFLADTAALGSWLKDNKIKIGNPESESIDAWRHLRKLARQKQKTCEKKTLFAREFVERHNFSIARAAEHPNCPSARYFIAKMKEIGK